MYLSSCNNSTKILELIYVNCCAYYLLVVLLEQEQLHEREQHILELEMKLEEKDRELHATKIDTEAVCFGSLSLSLSFSSLFDFLEWQA